MTITKSRREELLSMPSHIFTNHALDTLKLTGADAAKLLGVAGQTVYRWQRDPDRFPDASRSIDPTARRVLIWMMEPGRPTNWPAPVRNGWPISCS